MFVSACDLKRSQFYPSGQKSLNSSSHVGELVVVYGQSPLTSEDAKTAYQNYLYVMIVCPGVKAAESKAHQDGIEGDLMSAPVIYHSWETTTGAVRVHFTWDTRSDTVSVGREKFSRKSGNVFVLIRNVNGSVLAQQCGNLDSQADFPELMQHLRRLFSTNNLVSSVKFYRID